MKYLHGIQIFLCVSMLSAMEEGLESLPPLSVDEATTAVPLEYEALCGKPSIFEALSKIPKKLKHMRGECLKSETDSYRCCHDGCVYEETTLPLVVFHMVHAHEVKKIGKNFTCFLPADDGDGLCTISCKSKFDLLTHVKRYFDIKDILCFTCGEAFVSESDMKNRHKCKKRKTLSESSPELKQDPQTKEFQCCINGCTHRDADQKALVRHLETHADLADGKIQCPIANCRRWLQFTGNDLRCHLKWHYPLETFECECGMKFPRQSNFYDHLRKKHGIEPVLKNRKKDIVET